MKYYVNPNGERTGNMPRFVKLKSKRSVSIPKTCSDAEWLKIPGCTIIEA